MSWSTQQETCLRHMEVPRWCLRQAQTVITEAVEQRYICQNSQSAQTIFLIPVTDQSHISTMQNCLAELSQYVSAGSSDFTVIWPAMDAEQGLTGADVIAQVQPKLLIALGVEIADAWRAMADVPCIKTVSLAELISDPLSKQTLLNDVQTHLLSTATAH